MVTKKFDKALYERIKALEAQKDQIQKRMNELVGPLDGKKDNKLGVVDKAEYSALAGQMRMIESEMLKATSKLSLTELMDFASTFPNDS